MVTSTAFAKYPDHQISLNQYDGCIEVWFQGTKIASSDKALEMSEADYPLVYYIPFADCNKSHFHKTQHTTYCPFKGNASYWSLKVDSQQQENCVWGYEQPYDEVAEILNHVAFYSDRVEIRLI